ncbi:major capsid protein [Anguillid herpesvirus 1]|uniref:Major capsid protein n=1 Tax=Anguillid herpesvirus 1 TaxID=150286 RepID=A0A1J0REM2_9VIRU|nr:major capsid protein [Anguillid herpesvirus 1]QRM16790.1 major capsid protein [Anguillid herpesvirus 1]UTN00359.1 major capsid protein [Anguillid herpesvirus 1]
MSGLDRHALGFQAPLPDVERFSTDSPINMTLPEGQTRRIVTNNPGNVTELIRKFSGKSVHDLINAIHPAVSSQKKEPATGPDIDMTMATKVAVNLGRLTIGGVLTSLQTSAYAGLGLISKLVVPTKKPTSDNIIFKIDLMYDQQTMAMPNALRAITAGVGSTKSSMTFGLAQYTTGVNFLHRELTYLVETEMWTTFTQRIFAKLGDRFRLTILHAHAVAAARSPDFIETLLSSTRNHDLIKSMNGGEIAYQLASYDGVLLGICNRNVQIANQLVMMAVAALGGKGGMTSKGDYVALMPSTIFQPAMTNGTAICNVGMDVYTYKLEPDVNAWDHLFIEWNKPLLTVSGDGVVGKMAKGAGDLPTKMGPGTMALPAFSIQGGAIVPVIVLDDTRICENGPSMADPFRSTGEQWRWSTIGAPLPLVSSISPSILFSNNPGDIDPGKLNNYSPRFTSMIDPGSSSVQLISLNQLHVDTEQASMFQVNDRVLNAFPDSADSIHAYIDRVAGELWKMPPEQKLRHEMMAFEFSPRFMLDVVRPNNAVTAVVRPRMLMWNSTAMSSPSVELVSVAAELFCHLNLNAPAYQEAVAFIVKGSYGTETDVIDALRCKVFMCNPETCRTILQAETNNWATDPAHYNTEPPMIGRPLNRFSNNPVQVWAAHRAHVDIRASMHRVLHAVAAGNGHVLLTDPEGQSAFENAMALLHRRQNIGLEDGFEFNTIEMHNLRQALTHIRVLRSTILNWLPEMRVLEYPYVDCGHSAYAIAWSWMAPCIFNTCLSVTVNTHKPDVTTLPVGGQTIIMNNSDFVVLGNDLPTPANWETEIRFLQLQNAHPLPARHTYDFQLNVNNANQERLETANKLTTLFNRMDVSHISAGPMITSGLAATRAAEVRRQLAGAPHVALALGKHYSLTIDLDNLHRFDRDYYSGWAYCMVRRMTFVGWGFAVLPMKSHLMVLGNSEFDQFTRMAQENQWSLMSMLRFGIVPMGQWGQGVMFPNVYLTDVVGMSTDFSLNPPRRPQGAIGVRPQSSSFVLDWASSCCAPTGKSKGVMGSLLTPSGKFMPTATMLEPRSYMDVDPHNPDGYRCFSPFFNRFANERHNAVHNLLSRLGDGSILQFSPEQEMFCSNETVQRYMGYFGGNPDIEATQQFEMKLQSVSSGRFVFTHGFSNTNGLLYLDDTAIGRNSEQFFVGESGYSQNTPDNVNSYALVGRTLSVTCNPHKFTTDANLLIAELQGMALLAHLEVNWNSGHKGNIQDQIWNNAAVY